MDRSHRYAPFQARIYINGKPRNLGRFKTRAEAEAACKAARKLFPTRHTTKPPLSEATRNSIRAKLAEGLSHWKIAEEVRVSKGTVWRIAHERDDKAALGKDPREPVGNCW